MHRSGTTLVTSILQAAGVFMGYPLTENRESVFFQAINRDLLDALGCGWRALAYLPAVDGLASCAPTLAAGVKTRLEQEMDRRYWRARLWRARRQTRWGWKDPRTSVLLPVWRELFADATVVHVVRDGRRVARSLYERDLRTLGRSDVLDDATRRARFRADVALWATYEQRIRQSVSLFARSVSIRYESLVASPGESLTRLIDSLELTSATRVADLERLVDRERELAPSPPWMHGLADDNPLLSALGYPPERTAAPPNFGIVGDA